MYKTLLIITALLVTACSTTPTKLLETTPQHTFISDLPAKSVADCIVRKWDQTNLIGSAPVVSIRETNNGQRVMMYWGDNLKYIAEIEESGKGSKTRFYSHMVISFGDNPSVKEVESCQNS